MPPLSYLIFMLILILAVIILGIALYMQKRRSNTASADEEIISEIRGAIENHADAPEEKEMLKSVLDLDEIQVYDVMNHRKNLFSLDISTPSAEIISKLIDCPFSRVPLYQEKPDNIVGVIRVRHLLKAAIEKQGRFEEIDIKKLMSKPWFIPDTTTLLQQLQLFRARREHFAIVVDEYGDLQGIVTLEDILEEIVGDINDETDIESIDLIGIKKSADKKSLIIDGQLPLRDLNRRYNWNLNDENAVTLAGYLLDATRSIPQEGQKFIFEGFEFEVLKRSKNQLRSIRVTPPVTPQNTNKTQTPQDQHS